MRNKPFVFLAISFFVAVLGLAPGLSYADELSFPAQALSESLRALGNQTKTNMLFDPVVTAKVNAPAVSKAGGVEEALKKLLVGSGLTFRFVDARTVTVIPEDKNGAEKITKSKTDVAEIGSLRLAQAEGTTEGSATGGEQQAAPQDEEEKEEGVQLEEVVVTGTHIRGREPVGSQTLGINRDAIDKAGLVTAQDVARLIPQNFGGGLTDATANVIGSGDNAVFNDSVGTGFNLRGLGSELTLTLVDGRRVASSGFGHFVDVSMIPLSAVERVEVLLDGASAIYGSEAIGGVVNFILRRDYSGSQTRVDYGAVTKVDQNRLLLSHAFGRTWDSGHLLAVYEFYDQEALFSRDRRFAADSDLTALGGDNFGSIYSNPGTFFDSNFAQYAIPKNQDGTALQAADLIPGAANLQNLRERSTLLSPEKRHSILLTGEQALSERFSLFADARYSQREFLQRFRSQESALVVPSSNPFYVNPAGTSDPVFVLYSFLDDLGPSQRKGNVKSVATSGGAKARFADWQAELFGSFSQERVDYRTTGIPNLFFLNQALADPDANTAFNPFGDGSFTNAATIERIAGFTNNDSHSNVWSANAKADGPIFSLPGGEARLAVGLEYREEGLKRDGTNFDDSPVATPSLFSPNLDRQVVAGYAETNIPLVGDANALRFVRHLDISVAARYEHYSDFGNTVNPRFGVRWGPGSNFSIRGSYGRSFRAPLLIELDDSLSQYAAFNFSDPESPTGFSNFLQLTGSGNSNLQPEKSKNWSIGFDYAGPAQPIVSLTYYDITVRKRIASTDFFEVFGNPELYGSLIQRDPSAEVVQPLLDSPFADNVCGCSATDIDVIVDNRVRNLAVTNTRGLDANLSYSLKRTIGALSFNLNANYILDLEEAVAPGASGVETVDTVYNPTALRVRGSIGWSQARWSTYGFVNYVDGYTDNVSSPERSIGAWTTIDLRAVYRFGATTSDSAFGTEISLAVLNAFNEDPPFVNNRAGVAFDPTNASPQGRVVSLQLVRNW